MMIKRAWGLFVVLAAISLAHDLYADVVSGGLQYKWAFYVALFLISVLLSGLNFILGEEA